MTSPSSRETLHLVEEVRRPSKLEVILHSYCFRWAQSCSRFHVTLRSEGRGISGIYMPLQHQVLGGKSKDVPSAKQVEKNSRSIQKP